MNSVKSYIIWFTPRTGSTFLCDILEKMGVAGKPQELFNKDENMPLLQHYQQKDYIGLRKYMWNRGSTDNGVMAIKYSFYTSSFRSISNEIAFLRKLNQKSYLDWGILSDLFPNCKHIFLSRRNKVALVVSWWKAIQDGRWHVRDHNPASKSLQVYKGKYDFNALVHLLHDHCLRETATQAFFEHNQITPYSIFYEDLLLDLSGTISGILRYLNIDREEGQGIPPSDFKSTADQINREWIDRLSNDLQKDSNKVIW